MCRPPVTSPRLSHSLDAHASLLLSPCMQTSTLPLPWSCLPLSPGLRPSHFSCPYLQRVPASFPHDRAPVFPSSRSLGPADLQMRQQWRVHTKAAGQLSPTPCALPAHSLWLHPFCGMHGLGYGLGICCPGSLLGSSIFFFSSAHTQKNLWLLH